MENLFNTPENQEFKGVKSDLHKAMKGTMQYEEWKRKFIEALKKRSAISFISDNRFFMLGNEAKEVLSYKNGELTVEDAYDKQGEVETYDLTEDIKESEPVNQKPKPKKKTNPYLKEKQQDSREQNKQIKESLGFRKDLDFSKNYFRDDDLVALLPNNNNQEELKKWSRAVSSALNLKQRFTGSRFASLNDVINTYRKLFNK